jgi:hypothetical protein
MTLLLILEVSYVSPLQAAKADENSTALNKNPIILFIPILHSIVYFTLYFDVFKPIMFHDEDNPSNTKNPRVHYNSPDA